ncbi:hypothetical protein J1N35_037550 [Gossypium stocksii]|uniref:Uncharacterized protein n=1 Tax=Gossypium stocksii TaxID=47602 RepID=A0A9D3UKE7_9ROSI|nr:hypothetical protein J1N35_037550 [Gossypium stocksii]
MARMRGSVKKATKPIEEHSSSTIAVHKSKSSMPTDKNESTIFLIKAAKDQFQNILNQKFHQNWAFSFRNSLTPWDATKINELSNTNVDIDEHSKFIEDIIDNKGDLLVKDLCVEGALWIG